MPNAMEIVERAHTLKEIVDDNSSQYFHSMPLIQQETAIVLEKQKLKHSFNLYYGIKDLLLIGALTQSSVLMTGGTDTGKTTLAKLVMNSLFGKEEEGWHRIDVDIDFGKDTITDTDFGVIVKGEKSSEGFYKIQPYLLLPGLVTDEINRSHAKLVTKLMHIFDKDVSLPDGQRVKIGHDYNKGNKYQFQVAAINEGEEYIGTFEIDKALRRRTIIEIPMNSFPPTAHDREDIRKQKRKDLDLRNTINHLDDVLFIHNRLDQIELHNNADLFLSYLEAFDFCEYSLTQGKGSVASKGGSIYHICTKPVHGTDTICRFIKSFENELCPYIRGITPGISKNLISVAKGISILRAVKFAELLHSFIEEEVSNRPSFNITDYKNFTNSLQQYTGARLTGAELARSAFEKYVNELAVRPEDIEAIFEFVAYSKIGLSLPWIAKYYQGTRLEGIRSFVRQAKEKFEEGIAHLQQVDVSGAIGTGLAANSGWISLEEYCRKENPWFLKALQPYIHKRSAGSVKKLDLNYVYGR